MMDVRPEQVFKRFSFDNNSPDRVSRSQRGTIDLAASALMMAADIDGGTAVSKLLNAAFAAGAKSSHDVCELFCIERAFDNGCLHPAVTDEGQQCEGAVIDYCNSVYAAAGMDEDDAEMFVKEFVNPAFEYAFGLVGAVTSGDGQPSAAKKLKPKLVIVDESYTA